MVGSVVLAYWVDIVVQHLTAILEDQVQRFRPSLRPVMLSSRCYAGIRIVEACHRNSSGGGNDRKDVRGQILCCLSSQPSALTQKHFSGHLPQGEGAPDEAFALVLDGCMKRRRFSRTP